MLLRVLARLLDRLDRAVAPRRDRHAGLLGHQLGLDLVAQRAHHVAGRADEHQPHLLDHVRERGVLGDEAPAGPDGVGLGRDQRLLEALVVEVGAGPLAVLVDGRGRAEVVGLVGVADEHRAAFGLGVERDDADRIVRALGVELADGMDETHRGLAAIDDGETAKRALGHRRHGWHPRPLRCIPAQMEFVQPSKWREALEARAEHPGALPIWGGTDVMVELNFARKRPETLLDLTRVERTFALGRGGRLVADRRRRVVHAGDRRARRPAAGARDGVADRRFPADPQPGDDRGEPRLVVARG